ncbi:MAG: formimidoylglutamase [Cytophagales bacterium]|nr:formimidoylglutamase [Cytophagales bacterium]
MNLSFFLEPISKELTQSIKGQNSWIYDLDIYVDKFPKWKDAKIAIIGVPEQRGTINNKGTKLGPNQVRKEFYKLQKGSFCPKVVDLGNIKQGLTLEDTHGALRELCEFFMQNDIITLIIGGSHDMVLAQYRAFETREPMLNFVNVDAYLDQESIEQGLSKSYLDEVLYPEDAKKSYLWSYTHLAYQSYLTDELTTRSLASMWENIKRVGEIKGNIPALEPKLRDAHLFSFDVSAIRSGDFSATFDSVPFGLSSEEACQLTWYAGASDKLRTIGLYEYNPLLDNRNQSAKVVATMIWYFIEGYKHRLTDLDFSSSAFTKYIVSFDDKTQEKMTFYKHNITEKWWMLVDDIYTFPCAYEDYQMAVNGELPNRWLTLVSKLM